MNAKYARSAHVNCEGFVMKIRSWITVTAAMVARGGVKFWKSTASTPRRARMGMTAALKTSDGAPGRTWTRMTPFGGTCAADPARPNTT